MRLLSLSALVVGSIVTGSLIASGCASGDDGATTAIVDSGTTGGSSGSGGSSGKGGSGGSGAIGAGGSGASVDAGSGGSGAARAQCAEGESKPCYSGAVGTEGVGVCKPGTQTCTGGVWGGCEGEVAPGAEACNGLDDDCDGLADEDLGQTTCGQGVCQVTVENCVDGHEVECVPNQGNATEACDGTDDNCDGQVDEGCSCLDGQTQECYTGDPTTKGVGVCKAGTQSCSAGQWGACSGEVKSSAEKCNGLDDDCDGSTDEGNPEGGQDCMTGKPGVCSAGKTSCVNSTKICNQLVQPGSEVCDGQDNNCNGQSDEGNPESGSACNTGKPGICGPGTTQCQGGAVACVQNQQPKTETCDTIDNDCDGQTDEGCTCVNGQTQSCYTGPGGTQNVGTCKSGTQTCNNGQWGSCVGQVLPIAEACDSQDNNCNGQIDDGNPGGGGSCTTTLPGICTPGTLTCQGGSIVCKSNQNPAPTEICCNNIDETCNGQIDEGCSCGSTSCYLNCGTQAPGGCWCDSACSTLGDCCTDFVPMCSCAGYCGGSVSTPGGCYCDSQCAGFGDCCPNSCAVCGQGC